MSLELQNCKLLSLVLLCKCVKLFCILTTSLSGLISPVKCYIPDGEITEMRRRTKRTCWLLITEMKRRTQRTSWLLITEIRGRTQSIFWLLITEIRERTQRISWLLITEMRGRTGRVLPGC